MTTTGPRQSDHAPSAPTVGVEDVRGAVGHLKWVLVGVVLRAVGMLQVWPSEGHLWRIAPACALVGSVMILAGVARLARIRVDEAWHDRYGSAMRVVKWVAILCVARAILGQVRFERPGALNLVLSILALAELAAVVLGGLCMRALCLRAGLERAGRGWSIFLGAFAGFYMIPVAFYDYSAYVTQLGGQEYRYSRALVSVAGAAMTAVLAGVLGWAVWRMGLSIDE